MNQIPPPRLYSVPSSPTDQVADSRVFHLSEDPSITRFVPHVPRTNPDAQAAVWAIDRVHAPLYWFPRDCPRVTAWPRTPTEAEAFRSSFHTDAWRVHGAELAWLDRIRRITLFRYEFDASDFRPWADAIGQFVCDHPVEPLGVEPMGDLLEAHVQVGIELRFVPSLWHLQDLAVDDRWDFSLVRMSNARPRPADHWP